MNYITGHLHVQIQHITPLVPTYFYSVVQNVVILVCPHVIKGDVKVQVIKTLTPAR